MTIRELRDKYISQGYSHKDISNLVAEEIIIRKIASSELAEHVTFKGGIVLFNLSKNNRRVTQDIDFDLISYSIDNDSLLNFVQQLNKNNDGLIVSTNGNILELHQEDYHGARIALFIEDKEKQKIRFKLDVGVHTYCDIVQTKIIFSFDSNEKGIMVTANPPEQIFAEKLLSFARLGVVSTRFKDLYDFYYLIKQCELSPKKVKEVLQMFLNNSSREHRDVNYVVGAVSQALNNTSFAQRATQATARWIDVSFDDLKHTIVDFIKRF